MRKSAQQTRGQRALLLALATILPALVILCVLSQPLVHAQWKDLEVDRLRNSGDRSNGSGRRRSHRLSEQPSHQLSHKRAPAPAAACQGPSPRIAYH